MTNDIRASLITACALLILIAPAQAGWFDANWSYRRTLDVTWDAEHGTGEELAYAEFYTAGHHQPNGEDVRVATDEGRMIASHVLSVGPGDKVRVAFTLVKGQRKYAVYFGNAKPAPPPKGLDDVAYHSGLLMEMRNISGVVHANSCEEIARTWDDSAKNVVGRTFVATTFVGVNPFGELHDTIAKLSGQMYAPMDGDYFFAGAAENRGALFIDGKPVLFVPNCPNDIRNNTTVRLTRGKHEFVFYHVKVGGGDARLSVAWRPPSAKAVEVIPRETFGTVPRAVAGPLEESKKTLVADFKIEYLGECFYEDHYSHRYKISVVQPKSIAAQVMAEWNFGDGQTSTARETEHVYLADGAYPVRLTVKVGANSDTETNAIVVGRDIEQITSPPTDAPAVQARIVATYDVAKLPLAWLAWGAILEQRAKQPDAALPIAQRLAGETNLPNPDAALTALNDTTRGLIEAGRGDDAIAMWDRVPPASNLNPRAASQFAQILLWWSPDFARAVKLLEPIAAKAPEDKQIQRMYGEALVFAGQAEKGAILRAVQPEGDVSQQVVMSGAMARNLEHCIDESDWENGEEMWESWMRHYPTAFLEGYAVLLRTKLMEARKNPRAAALVAEAFAMAVPKSSYAPQLLDRASKLLERIDSRKSESLRIELKEKYPEDPLAQ